MFCANDLLALGLMVQLRELGVRIPDEMGVIGYDDIEFAGVAVPPLSSVRQPRAELGRTAAELLAAELDEGEAPPPPPRHLQAGADHPRVDVPGEGGEPQALMDGIIGHKSRRR